MLFQVNSHYLELLRISKVLYFLLIIIHFNSNQIVLLRTSLLHIYMIYFTTFTFNLFISFVHS